MPLVAPSWRCQLGDRMHRWSWRDRSWLRVETIHAVDLLRRADDRGRAEWPGSPASGWATSASGPPRLGAVGSGAVEATFFNFAPFVRATVGARRLAARLARGARGGAEARLPRSSLRELPPGIEAVASRVNPVARRGRRPRHRRGPAAVRRQPADRRCPTTPSRRCGSFAPAFVSIGATAMSPRSPRSGLDGCEAHVLISLEQGSSPEDLQRARGWTTDDWSDATSHCIQRGLVDGAGGLTAEGRALRANIEATTDRLAAVSSRRPRSRRAHHAARRARRRSRLRSQPQG